MRCLQRTKKRGKNQTKATNDKFTKNGTTFGEKTSSSMSKSVLSQSL